MVECQKCHTSVTAHSYNAHLDAGCRASCDSPSKHTVRELLDAPANLPVTPMEARATGRVIERLMNQEGTGSIVRVQARGKVCV